MNKKTISRTWLMAVAVLLIGACLQTSAQSGELQAFKGWGFYDTNDIQPRTWADLPGDANSVLSKLILSDENSALLPPGDGPSGLPAELQWVGGTGNNSAGGNTKNDAYSLAHFHVPTLTLYLWDYEIWTSEDGDQMVTTNKVTLSVATMTLTGTKTVIGGTGKFAGAVSNPIKTFGGETNGTAALIYDGWIYLPGPTNEATPN